MTSGLGRHLSDPAELPDFPKVLSEFTRRFAVRKASRPVAWFPTESRYRRGGFARKPVTGVRNAFIACRGRTLFCNPLAHRRNPSLSPHGTGCPLMYSVVWAAHGPHGSFPTISTAHHSADGVSTL